MPRSARTARALVFAAGAALGTLALACDSSGSARGDSAATTPRDTTAPAALLPFSVPASRAGRLTLAGDTLRFTACDVMAQPVTLTGSAVAEGAAVVRELGGGGGGIASLVVLAGDTLREIRFAAPEGAPCDMLPPPGALEARGNEPFWAVRIVGDSAVVMTPEDQAGTTWRGGRWSGTGPWRFEATLADGTARLVLEVVEERCADGMSGARFPFTATLERGGERVRGCALEGRDAIAALAR